MIFVLRNFVFLIVVASTNFKKKRWIEDYNNSEDSTIEQRDSLEPKKRRNSETNTCNQDKDTEQEIVNVNSIHTVDTNIENGKSFYSSEDSLLGLNTFSNDNRLKIENNDPQPLDLTTSDNRDIAYKAKNNRNESINKSLKKNIFIAENASKIFLNKELNPNVSLLKDQVLTSDEEGDSNLIHDGKNGLINKNIPILVRKLNQDDGLKNAENNPIQLNTFHFQKNDYFQSEENQGTYELSNTKECKNMQDATNFTLNNKLKKNKIFDDKIHETEQNSTFGSFIEEEDNLYLQDSILAKITLISQCQDEIKAEKPENYIIPDMVLNYDFTPVLTEIKQDDIASIGEYVYLENQKNDIDIVKYFSNFFCNLVVVNNLKTIKLKREFVFLQLYVPELLPLIEYLNKKCVNNINKHFEEDIKKISKLNTELKSFFEKYRTVLQQQIFNKSNITSRVNKNKRMKNAENVRKVRKIRCDKGIKNVRKDKNDDNVNNINSSENVGKVRKVRRDKGVKKKRIDKNNDTVIISITAKNVENVRRDVGVKNVRKDKNNDNIDNINNSKKIDLFDKIKRIDSLDNFENVEKAEKNKKGICLKEILAKSKEHESVIDNFRQIIVSLLKILTVEPNLIENYEYLIEICMLKKKAGMYSHYYSKGVMFFLYFIINYDVDNVGYMSDIVYYRNFIKEREGTLFKKDIHGIWNLEHYTRKYSTISVILKSFEFYLSKNEKTSLYDLIPDLKIETRIILDRTQFFYNFTQENGKLKVHKKITSSTLARLYYFVYQQNL